MPVLEKYFEGQSNARREKAFQLTVSIHERLPREPIFYSGPLYDKEGEKVKDVRNEPVLDAPGRKKVEESDLRVLPEIYEKFLLGSPERQEGYYVFTVIGENFFIGFSNTTRRVSFSDTVAGVVVSPEISINGRWELAELDWGDNSLSSYLKVVNGIDKIVSR